MRISDWSSDVCSSDLIVEAGLSELPRLDERAHDILEHRDPHRLVETAPRFLDRTLPAQPGGGEDVDLDQQPPRPALIGPAAQAGEFLQRRVRSEEHTSALQSLMRISYAVFCLKKNTYYILMH